MEIINLKNDQWLTTYDAFEIYKQCMYKATFDEYKEKIGEFSGKVTFHIFGCCDLGINKGIIILENKSCKTVEIVGIAVKKELQNSGLGRFMVNFVASNFEIITAETDEDSVGFYKSIGFSATPFVRHFEDGDVTRFYCELKV